MIYFTADTHFNHKNIIRFCNRPFQDVIEMNEVLIERWNKTVRNEDTIYHLGDVGFGYINHILDRLNGNKILILGSHDKDLRQYEKYFNEITPLANIVIQKQPITLCHYAMRTWHRSHYNSWQLYGHSHGLLKPQGKSWDVGVDVNEFTPISFYTLKTIMKDRPDNFNLIK